VITVISGMARSGTSLTMQMLNAAGFPIYWDREPNYGPANPKGYFEVIGRDWREHADVEGLLCKMEDKAVKVFPRNWDYFTDNHRYQFIYLDRDPVNIRDSQRRMLDLEQRVNEKGNPEEHLRGIIAYRRRSLRILQDYRHVIVPYEGLYTGTTQWAIADFLELTVAQRNVMWGCVDHELHHFK
jgi:hypothetical protein